jgi:hypothetical protein
MAKLSMDKNKKWQKRNFYTKDSAIYYSKDKKVGYYRVRRKSEPIA